MPPVRAGLPAGVMPAMLVPEPMSAYLVGGPGPTVHIEGGGGGTSNCTNDETSKTSMAYADPTCTSVSFTVKDSGSCGSEASWSYLTTTSPGGTARGTS